MDDDSKVANWLSHLGYVLRRDCLPLLDVALSVAIWSRRRGRRPSGATHIVTFGMNGRADADDAVV